MHAHIARVLRRVLFTVAALLLFGCDTTRQSSRQLSRVAKDWCLNIRASQVIPVYPLSEDVEVGDVYLVRTRLESQVQVYEEEGFLPLENLVTRLPVTGYREFYRGGYQIGDDSRPPRHWQFPTTASTQQSGYAYAPRAAFPTYGFSVSRGEGASVAIPVQGVPVGLSVLNAATARGSIAITEAYTYGLSLKELQDLTVEWANKNRTFLKQFEPTVDKNGQRRSHFLRVVNRVYLAGRVDISLVADQVSGGEARVGAGAGLNIPAPTRNDPAASLAALNEQLANAIPAGAGGSLKVTAASARTIALTETFARPLVIGYIGFDLEVLEDGQCGPPVPTQQRLERPNQLLNAAPVAWQPDDNTALIRAYVDARPENLTTLRQWLAASPQRSGIGVTPFIVGADHGELRRQFVAEHNLRTR